MSAALLRQIGGALLALFLLVLVHAAWRMADAVPWVRALMTLAIALAALRPRDALLVLAGLGPVIGAFGAMAGAPYSLRELLVLATLTGWGLRVAIVRYRKPLLPPDLFWPLISVASVVLASMAVELYGARALAGPAEFNATLRYTLGHGLLSDRHAVRGLNGGVMFLEGLAVFSATVVACAQRPAFASRVATMAAIGAAGAALLNIQRIVNAAIASAAPFQRLRELLATIRVNIHFADVNAAGSYFALMFFPAATQVLCTRGWRRVVWGGAAGAVFAAAWLTGSRAAVAAILAVSVVATLIAGHRQSWRSLPSVAAVVFCAAVAATFVAAFPNKVMGPATSIAVEIRTQMARVSFGMLRQHPFFGVGVGGYYDASAPLLEASTIGFLYARENAHNNLLQLLAEFGIVGFAAFVWLFWRVAQRIKKGLRIPEQRIIAAGTAAGLLAFALTAMLGHPLLTAEVNHAFWLLLGVASAGPQMTATGQASRLARHAGLALAALVLVLLPWRFRTEATTLNLEHVRYGVSGWATDSEGTRYVTFAEHATLFVPTRARAFDIPLRLEQGAAPVTVEITFRNRVADQVVVTPASWHVYRLMVASSRGDPPYLPVQLRTLGDDAPRVQIGRTVAR